jgi:hypothetical protein
MAALLALLLPSLPAILLAPRWAGVAGRASSRVVAPMRTPGVLMELVLTEENVVAVLNQAERELGTMFGSDPQSARVGITGKAEFVELDGPTVVLRLSGRFWHARARVLERLEAYILERIPETVAVEVEDPSQLEDALDPATGLPINEVPGLGPPPPLL